MRWYQNRRFAINYSNSYFHMSSTVRLLFRYAAEI
jgi:hypothetical protein